MDMINMKRKEKVKMNINDDIEWNNDNWWNEREDEINEEMNKYENDDEW